jgi:oligoribonuclease NrnB/cAMP/cGMP phosphodiesterase (DHH superfamily)
MTPSDADALPPLVIYHHNCADGFSAAWVFHHAYQLSNARPVPEFVPGRYGSPPPDVTGRHVYLVDFSYKAPVIEQMLDTAASVTLIDHHATALDELQHLAHREPPQRRLRVVFDLQRSGATLAWDYMFPGRDRPLLLGHIEDRDLWRFKLPHTREIQAAVFSHPYTFEVWDKLMAADPHDLLALTAQGAAIARKHRKDVTELVETCRRRMHICGHEVWAASLPHIFASDAGELMCQGEPFAAVYWDTAEHRQFSLRSRGIDGADVAALAATMGGGGHRNAAGFRVPRSHHLAQE